MGLSRTQRIARSDRTASGAGALQLSPQDYFVLSRIEGSPTVAEAIVASGLGRDEAHKILEHLFELGAIVVREAPRAAVSPDSSATAGATTEARRRARERRKSMLGAMLSTRTSAEDRPRTPPAEPNQPTPVQERAAPTPEPTPFVDIELVAEDDQRLDPNIAIPIDDQRWLLGLVDNVHVLDEFGFLGIPPTQDLKAIRRAYHERSRRLHPDAYYGRELGPFRNLLAALFSQAKQAHLALQDPQVRKRAIEREAARREARVVETRARAQESSLVGEEEARRQAELDEAETQATQERRRARAQGRVQRQRSQMRASLLAEARRHADEAERAYKEGNLAKAANFYRLALRADPDDTSMRARWEQIRDEARRARSATAFTRGVALLDVGHTQEAAVLLIDAADADPTLEHLAYAADAVRHSDPERARDLALAALDALQRTLSEKASSKDSEKGLVATQAARFHLMIGRAFLAAGQVESARLQATAAMALQPDDPSVRALVNSIKVP